MSPSSLPSASPADLTTARSRWPAVSCHHVEVDGLRLFYRQAGDPLLPTLVLLHGFPSSSHMFRDLMPLLAARFHVVAPDYVGFGHSAAPDVHQFAYTFARQAELMQALLDRLGLQRYMLYMQDYGGPIGMRLATAQPQRVTGLVFQNANLYMEGVSEAAQAVFMPLWQHGDETGARQMLLPETTRYQYLAGARRPDALNPDAWVMDQALLDRPGSAERQLALFRDYQHNVALYERWQAYLRAHQPRTLVAWGEGDPFFTVAGAQAFARDLKEVAIHLLPSGHFALEEEAATVAALISSHFPA